MKMHAGQLHVDEEIARRLIAEQVPQWREERVVHVDGGGTVNAIFRIGDGLAARFPLNSGDPVEALTLLRKDAAAMQELAATCPVDTPLHIALGTPAHDYPLPWSVQTWIPGDVATPDGVADSLDFTRDLSALLRVLRNADTGGRGFAGTGRGGDLRDSDSWIETCLHESKKMLPVEELRALWERFRTLPSSGPDRITHGDLIPANLLVDEGRLIGVLDGGGFGPADPALDLVVAWHLLDGDMRDVLRGQLRIDAIEWQRGAAWAFQQSMGLVWYYSESNPRMSALGRSTLRRILSDPEISSTTTAS